MGFMAMGDRWIGNGRSATRRSSHPRRLALLFSRASPPCPPPAAGSPPSPLFPVRPPQLPMREASLPTDGSNRPDERDVSRLHLLLRPSWCSARSVGGPSMVWSPASGSGCSGPWKRGSKPSLPPSTTLLLCTSTTPLLSAPPGVRFGLYRSPDLVGGEGRNSAAVGEKEGGGLQLGHYCDDDDCCSVKSMARDGSG
ncbi:hypothetical protein DAI22_07g134700 [Oryza sativa Japonica Group]|nr:hypothetical protein DAI22_07g134700 [Oryza sativa Japonica Group]